VPGAHMRAEIAEQPQRWLDLARTQADALDAAAQLIVRHGPQLLVFAARGSSDHAAQYGQYLAHRLLRTPAMLATPASMTVDAVDLHYPRAVMLALSQSGESPDLLATVQSARDAGTPVIAFTNSHRSTLAGLASVHVPLAAGPERSVAATKTYTAELLAVLIVLARAAGIDVPDVSHLARDASAVLEAAGRDVPRVLEWADSERVLCVGRGTSMSSAKEAALKLMETSAIAASGWSAADATHGPLGQVVPGTPVLAFTAGAGATSVMGFSRAARANGARVLPILAAPTDEAVDEAPLAHVHELSVDSMTAPLLEILPIQRFALELALARGLDPDAPRGLRKVTATR